MDAAVARRQNKWLERLSTRIHTAVANGTYGDEAFYEPQVTDEFIRAVFPGAAVLDVGAYLGFYSHLSLRAGAASVTAFEPHKRVYGWLRHQFGGNERVRLYNKAVHDHDGKVTLLHSGDMSGRAIGVSEETWMDWRGPAPELKPVELPCVRLDDVIDHRVDVVKIDVEGAEAAVLRGAIKVLSEHLPVVFLSVHAMRQERLDKLLEVLGRLSMYSIEMDQPLCAFEARDVIMRPKTL